MTYRQLRSLAGSVGEQLASEGIAVGDTVAVVGPNGPEMAAAFLTIGASATVAPLNPRYQRAEYEFFLTDLKPAALVLWDKSSPAAAAAHQLGIRVALLRPGTLAGEFSLEFERPSTAIGPEHRFASDNDEALVLHTSGTTARPKIVPLTHSNLCANAAYIAETLQLTPDDRSLVVMPLFHIHGLIGVLLSTMHSGGTAICTAGFDGEAFFDWLKREQPTWYSAAPTMHQSVLAGLESGIEATTDRLRFVRSSSASLPAPVIDGLEAHLGVPVIEAYGMTEASHQMTINPLPPGVRKPGSVGPANDRARVVGPDWEDLGAGDVGDVLTAGPNVTHGYRNNDEANGEAFRDGWFSTGDLGYLDDDGFLFLTGRKKEIINRGGEKVSPREVDDVLAAHPAVQQVVTFAMPHATLGEDVAAAVVVRDGHAFEERKLRQFALERLAGFKVPSFVVAVGEIPKGATGKLQRIGLADLLADVLETRYVAPQSPTEEMIAAIWGQALGRDGIGSTDNFFQIGGDSITAAMVAARIRETTGVEVPLPVIFYHPTVRDFAEAVLALQLAATPSDEMDEYLSELDAMTDEEAAELLAKTTDGSDASAP